MGPWICDMRDRAFYQAFDVCSESTAKNFLHDLYQREGRKQVYAKGLAPNQDFSIEGKVWTIRGYSGNGTYRLTAQDWFHEETSLPVEK